jgi:hypothetical protein
MNDLNDLNVLCGPFGLTCLIVGFAPFATIIAIVLAIAWVKVTRIRTASLTRDGGNRVSPSSGKHQ